jgi:two-component system phosphate regulon response regulator OmpR
MAYTLHSSPTMSPAEPSRRRALVAEDDEEMRALVTDTLRSAGFDVESVGDGRQMWIRMIQRATYDLVISDFRLPVVDGLTVLEDYRERAPVTPLIVMSAFGDDVVRTRVEKLGAFFLDKPFRMGELRAAVRRICDANANANGTPIGGTS